MPREIAPGVFWIGDCLAQRHQGKIYHAYNAAFLVAGETASVLVETGHPKDFPVIERHLSELFARGAPALKYLFVTHQETPHCGGLGRILQRFPEAILCGDVSDYHLAFPHYESRMRWMNEGDAIDLGGRSLMAVEPVIPATASPTATITRTATAVLSRRRRSRSTCRTCQRCSRTWPCSGPSSPTWTPIAIGWIT
jgi:flavorubredoxin